MTLVPTFCLIGIFAAAIAGCYCLFRVGEVEMREGQEIMKEEKRNK